MKSWRIPLTMIACSLGLMISSAEATTNLPIGSVTKGTISSPGQVNPYTFDASAGDVFIFTVVTTSGHLNPEIWLYNPDGSLNSSNYANAPYDCAGTVVSLNSGPFKQSGQYTLDVGDCNSTNIGTYNLYTQRVKNPVSAPNLPLGLVTIGTIGLSAQDNTYTLNASAGDVLVFDQVTTTGNLNPAIWVYNPDGSLNSSTYANSPYDCAGTVAYLTTAPLKQSGQYTVFVGDCVVTNTGGYNLYAQRANNPAGAVDLLWGQVQPGQISLSAQYNTYTFQGSTGDVVDLMQVVTTSGQLTPAIYLYNPQGTLIDWSYANYPYDCAGTTADLSPVTLKENGNYTLLVGDCVVTKTGIYNLTSQCLVGPCVLPNPIISGISPSSAVSGSSSLKLIVTGRNFVDGSVVRWNGTPLQTTFVSSTELTATIPVTDLSKPGIFPITVEDSGGPVSNPVSFTVQGAPAVPVFSPPGGTYDGPQSVTIRDATSGSMIYCTHGSTPASTPTPTVSSADLCTLPISVTTTETIKAIAAIGSNASSPATATYVIETAAPPPIFSPAAETYCAAQWVTLTDRTTGAVIYYTTNGSTPRATPSEEYKGPILVLTTETIKAIAVAPGYTNSIVAESTDKVIGSPYVLAVPPAAVGTSTATLSGMINTEGLTGSYLFSYGTSGATLNHSTKTIPLPASGANVIVNAQVTGLTPKTKYYYSVTAATCGGTATGAVLSFMTQ